MMRILPVLFPVFFFVSCTQVSQVDKNMDDMFNIEAYNELIMSEYLSVKDSFKVTDTLALIKVYELDIIKRSLGRTGDSTTHHMIYISSYPNLDDPYFYFEYRKFMPKVNHSTPLNYIKVNAHSGEVSIMDDGEGVFLPVEEYIESN